MLNLCASTTSNVSIFMLSLLDLPFFHTMAIQKSERQNPTTSTWVFNLINGKSTSFEPRFLEICIKSHNRVGNKSNVVA